MKKFLILVLASTIFFSCGKDKEPDPQQNAFAALQGKYLVCDSVITTQNGSVTKQVLGKGKGWDISFGLYGNLDTYTTPPVTKSYMFETPDKIYYWKTSYQSNQFYKIQSITSNKIVLVDTEVTSGKIMTEYFTAE